MRKLPYKYSTIASLGVELEFQIIDPITYDMISKAKEIMRNTYKSVYSQIIKPEVTQSMIEINSSIHLCANDMYTELLELQAFLLQQGKILGICFSGGGTHPFQKWMQRKIFPSKRFKNKLKHYRYLTKNSTVFGQHIHIGCPNEEDAIYLTHALARYVPQFIALSASSPFYQGVDTGYYSSRSHTFSAYPLSGVMPYLSTWEEFSNYYYKMHDIGAIKTMKDFYWDIRPKPEFGTVEVRVCDTPLTIKKAMIIAAYIQSLSLYLLCERPKILSPNLYYFYSHNRFQAARFGLKGQIVDPKSLLPKVISEDILETTETITKYSNDLNNQDFISQLVEGVTHGQSDTTLLRKIFHQVKSFPNLVHEQCLIWKND